MNETLKTVELAPGLTVQLVQGDITGAQVDGIVNAANDRLQHGGGVAGVIARRGGPSIQRESTAWVKEHGPVDHATPAVTGGGDLPCEVVIHAVGPVWGAGEEAEKLRAAVTGSLQAAATRRLSSLALPAISTGIYSYPLDQAAEVILTAIRDYAAEAKKTSLETVQVVLYDQPAVDAFSEVWETLF